MNELLAKIQLRHDVASNWATANPVLLMAEEGYESDTGFKKIGDGVTPWNSLSYPSAISGLTSGRFPVATSPTTIGNSYLNQTAGSVVIDDGKTIASVNGFSVLNFYSGGGIGITYDDGAGTTGGTTADNLSATLVWSDGVNEGDVTAQATNLLLYHTSQLDLDAPIIYCPHLTVSTLPYIDVAQHFKSSSIIADGDNLSFTSGHGIDTTATVGSDVLNIGVANANVINYGNSSTVHNFLGTAIYETQTNSYVTDKLITLNSGGAVASGIGVGFEIEENAIITGYFKTNAARTGFSIKSPANTDYTDFVFGSTVPRTKTFQDTTSTIAELGNKLSVFAATTSAELAGVISDETGYAAGAFLVFSKSPTIDAPTFSTSINGSYLTASSIVETDASKNLISAAKNTAYNKAFGTTAGTVAEGNDSRFSPLLVSAADGTVVTGVTETITYSGLIPANTVSVNDVLMLRFGLKWSTVLATKGFTVRINTSVAIGGSIIINLPTGIGAGVTSTGYARRLAVKSATVTETIGNTATGLTDEQQNTSVALSTFNIDWTVDQYLIITIKNSNAGESGSSSFVQLRR